MKKPAKMITTPQWVALAPEGERFIPLNESGTHLYDRENRTVRLAQPTPEGREAFRQMFRRMAMKARALGYRKAP